MMLLVNHGVLLITGGTGTFGKAFLETVDLNQYSKIIIFSRDEYKQHQLKMHLVSKFGSQVVENKFRFFLGDVRDLDRLRLAFRGVTEIIHTAALKHVPFCEYNPSEALQTNVIGTKNVCDAAIECGVQRVVVLSTDKAVEPINFYGSTKMLAERYAVHSNVYGAGKTKIACVRYGNIIGSRGSIVEVFRNQPKEKPFDITHIDMTRFWLPISEAVRMVRKTLEFSFLGGEIIIPKVKASSVVDLARAIDPDRPITDVGIRPGEKLHEQLISRREGENLICPGFIHMDEYMFVLPESAELAYVKDYYRFSSSNVGITSYYSNDSHLQMTMAELREIVKL